MHPNKVDDNKCNSSFNSKLSQHPSDNDFLSYEQQTNQITLQIRNLSNSPFINNIDHSIKSIIPYQFTKCQYFYFIITFGILYIMCRISNRMYIKFRGVPCKVINANFFLIIDEDNHYHISPMHEDSFADNQSHRDEVCETKINLFSAFPNEKKQVKFIYFTFKTNRYYHCESGYSNEGGGGMVKEYFTGPTFDLSRWSNYDIRKTFMEHNITEHGINYQRVKFGENKLEMANTNFCIILLLQSIQPFFLIQLFNIALWIYEEYYFCYISLATLIFVLMFTSYQIYANKKKIIEFSNDDYKMYDSYMINKETKAIEKREISHIDLVPGQIIFLKVNDVIPCDCVILEGACSVVESSLSGESTFVLKEGLPNQQLKFEYKHNQSLLFCGTKIEKVYTHSIEALVIGTGFNTQRGSLIQQVLFPRKSNFRPYQDMVFYLLLSLIVYLGAVSSFIIAFYFKTQWINATSEDIFHFVIKQLDMIAMIFPPALPLCLSIGNFFYQMILSMRNIKCCDENRLNAAGRVNKIILDKTGTLTKEDLEIYGFQTIKHNDYGKIVFDTVEETSKIYSLYHLEYYKRKFHQYLMKVKAINDGKYQEDSDDSNTNSDSDDMTNGSNDNNRMTLFLECLATCHSLNEIDGNYKGEALDLQIFNTVKWVMYSFTPIRDPNDKRIYSNDKHRIIKPRNHYKITEEQFFFNTSSGFGKNQIKLKEEDTNYELLVLHQSAFESSKQSMHVVVKNNFDKSMRFYIKGAPEKICGMCSEESLPSNVYEKLSTLTLTGFRVLACATRKLNIKEEAEINAKEIEGNHKLTFLGLIIFRNRIKKKSKTVIRDLIQGGLNPIISTGDNAFTSISVAKDCEIVSSESKIWTIEHKDPLDKDLVVKFSSIVFDKNAKSETYEFKYLNNNQTFSYKDASNQNLNINNINLCPTPKKFGERRASVFLSSHNKTLEELLQQLQTQNAKLCVNSEIFRTLFIKSKNMQLTFDQEDIDNEMLYRQKIAAYKDLKEIILKQAVLYYRMNPTDKTNLIDLFKQDKSNIISMCGDGANDCGALNYSDIGISLKSKDSQLMTAHFMSENKSIEAINIVISIGRTCYENREILFKVILLSVVTGVTHTVILSINEEIITNSQFMFIDAGIVLLGCTIASCSMPNFSKTQSRFTIEVLRWPFFFTILGHTILQVGIIISYYFIVCVRFQDYQGNEVDTGLNRYQENKTTILNSYFFILYAIQCLSYVYVFNYFSIQKRAIVENKIFVVYILVLLLVLIGMISIDFSRMNKTQWLMVNFIPLKEDEIYPQVSRLILFGMCVLAFVSVFGYEWIFLKCLDRFIERKMMIRKDEVVKKEEEVSDEEKVKLSKEVVDERKEGKKVKIEERKKTKRSTAKKKTETKEKNKEQDVDLDKTDMLPINNNVEVNNELHLMNDDNNNNEEKNDGDDIDIDIIVNPEDSIDNHSFNNENENINHQNGIVNPNLNEIHYDNKYCGELSSYRPFTLNE